MLNLSTVVSNASVRTVFLALLLITMPTHAQTADDLLVEVGAVQVDDKPLDAVAFHDTLIATGGRDNLVRLWHVDNPTTPHMTLSGHSDRITDLAFSPDASRLASASADSTVRVWDVATGEVLHIVVEHDQPVMSVAFSPDGTLLASGGRDARIRLGDPSTGATFTVLENFEQPVWSLAFTPDSAQLVSGSEDGAIWLWGMGDAPSLRQLTGHTGPVMRLTFAGETLVSGGMDGLIRMWNLNSDDDPLILGGHLAPVTGIAPAGDDLLLSASLDGTVRAWDTAAGEELLFLTRDNLPLTALGRFGESLAVVGTEGVLSLWRIGDLTAPAPVVVQNSNPPPQNDSPPPPVAPPPDNGTYISIPVAGVMSPVTSFPLDGTSWAIDPWEPNVGYMQGTAWLDERGNTVLGGHSEYPDGTAGIFRDLYDVSVGDVILVTEDGAERQYVVVEIRTVHYTDLTVLYPTTHSRLTLITCDVPSFDVAANVYYERLVVIADLIE